MNILQAKVLIVGTFLAFGLKNNLYMKSQKDLQRIMLELFLIHNATKYLFIFFLGVNKHFEQNHKGKYQTRSGRAQ